MSAIATQALHQDSWEERLQWGRDLIKWYETEALGPLTKNCSAALLEQIQQQAASLARSLNNEHRTEVAFLGTTTVGKSTTINAVLGRRLLPENRIGSTTAAKVIVQFGEFERLTISYVTADWLDQEFKTLAADWQQAIEDEEITGEGPQGDFATSIERRRSIVRNALGLPSNHQLKLPEVDVARIPQDIRERLGTQREFAEDIVTLLDEHVAGRFAALVDRAVVTLPNRTLQDGLAIVDLPGTGDADEGRIRALREYIDRAEQLVLVLSIQLITTDVQNIIVSSDLLTRLQAHKRPFVIVGTKLDTSNPPTSEQLAEYGLLGTLSGLRATETMWEAKAERDFFKLLARQVDKTHPKATDETEEDYRARVWAQFGQCTILPINPRASLELDAGTRAPHTPDKQIEAWRAQYPNDADTGIDSLRAQLRAIATAGRDDAQQRISREIDQFHKAVTSILKNPATATDGGTDAEALENEIKKAGAAAQEQLAQIEGQLEVLRKTERGRLQSIFAKATGEPAAKRARQVEVHLRSNHQASVRASIRDPRDGVWNKVHVPNALFDEPRQRALEVWRSVENGLQGLSQGVLNACTDYMRGLANLLEMRLKGAAAPHLIVLDGHENTLLARVEAETRACATERTKKTGPLADQTEHLAKKRLRPVASQAAMLSGSGVTKKVIAELSGAAGAVSADVLPQVNGVFQTHVDYAADGFKKTVLQKTRAAITVVTNDMVLAVRHTPTAHVDEDSASALATIPRGKSRTDVPRSNPTPSPSGDFPPFLIGTAMKRGDDVYWDPARRNQALNNFGMLLTGDSGSGKTQLIKALIAHLCQSRIPTWIFDFKNDFSDENFMKSALLRRFDVSRQGLPFNPLALVPVAGQTIQPIRHVHEITHCLERIYKLGVRQAGRLRKALTTAYEEAGINPFEHLDAEPARQPCFDDVRSILEQNETDNEGLLNRLSPLLDFGLFPKEDSLRLDQMLGSSVVLSLYDLPNDRIKLALAEFLIMRLHAIVLRGDQPRELRRMLVFDEAWRVGANERLMELGREGRAFGVGILVSSQFPDDVPESLRGNLATRIYLANTDTRHRTTIEKQLGSQIDGGDLVALGKHEGFIQSAHYSPALKVRTKPFFERSSLKQ